MKRAIQKLLCLALVLTLTLSISLPAFALGEGASAGASSMTVEAATLPTQDWQAVVSFPDWAGYVDDTLVMNNLYSFTSFSGQGELYVTVAEGVTGFRMFVNNVELDTSAMKAGATYRVDISSVTLDGTNTVEVAAIQPITATNAITVYAPYPVVVEGDPAAVGMDASILDLIGDFVQEEVKYGFSGAQLAVVKEGKMVYSNAWGAANGYRSDGSRIEPDDEDYVPVTTDTLYDLASNTKMYSVNYAIQYLYDQGKISLDAHITDFFPEFDDEGKTIYKDGTSDDMKANILRWKGELTVRDILMHQAGFDPDPQYHNDQFNQVTQRPEQGVANPLFSQEREKTLQMVLASPLTYEPGTRTVYSDVDYMLLCFIIEKVTGKNFDAFLKETFYEPMGLTHITYKPLENGFKPEDCAATELNGNSRDGVISFQNIRTGVIQGTVHDEKAYYAMEGVSGHAGLFSNAEDLAKLCSVMLTGGYGGHKFFSKNTIDLFTKAKSPAYPTWGLGWWRNGEIGRANYFSTHASEATFGHQGWTGTLTVIDPEEDLVVVLLTNKKNSPVIDPTIDSNDFYSDNMVLGSLGAVTGLVYESFTSTPDAMDSAVMQMAKERIWCLTSHKNAYDEAVHMNDAYALVDLVVTRAEQRQTQITLDYARQVLKDLNDFVRIYIAKEEDLANAAKWSAELQARIDAIQVTAPAPAAPVMTAVAVETMPGVNASGNFVGGSDQNAVYFPAWSGRGATSHVYRNAVTWFNGYEGQGTVYFRMRRSVADLRIFINGHEVDTTAMKNTVGNFAIDVSAYTINGRNSVQVTDMDINVARSSMLMVVTNPEVIEGTPADVGIDTRALDLIDDIIQSDVDHGFTSAQLAVIKDGRMVYSNAWGTVNAYQPDGTPKTDSPAVTTDTLYDLASNTKMYATNYAIQYLMNNNRISLTDPITKYFPEFDDEGRTVYKEGTSDEMKAQILTWKSQLTVQDILQHQAGFDPDPQYHNDQFNQATQKPEQGVANPLFSQERTRTLQMVLASPLTYEPGTRTVYSDVDFMLLGFIIEKITGKDLDTFCKETFYTPLGLTHITFNPLENGFTADQIAATELNGNSRDGVISFQNIREGTIQGTVHDEKAYYAMNGISGHAGLFSNAEDLATLASAMLNQSGYGVYRLFNNNYNEYFTSRKDTSATWGQGWWRQADCGRPWYFGVQASRNTIGHQGWTGTLTVIDPVDKLVIVYLTNKINSPVTDNTTSPNQFDGNWYTSSTLGFVANILYQGLSSHDASTDIQPALDALTGDMVIEKLRLVNDENTLDPNHPIMQSFYALADLVYEMAEARPTEANLRAKELLLSNLEPIRDSDLETARAAAAEAVKAAEEAQKSADEARKVAEEIAAAAGENKEYAEQAAQEAKAAQEAADAAKAAAADAQTALAAAEAAAKKGDRDATKAAAQAVDYAAQAAGFYAEIAAGKIDMVKYLANSQKAAAEAAATQAALDAANLALAKYDALLKLATYGDMLTVPAGHEDAVIDALTAGAEAIANAEKIEDVKAALENAKKAAADATVCPAKDYTDVDLDAWYHEAVDYMLSKGYMNGVGGNRFDVDGSLTRAQLVTILYRVAGTPEVKDAKNPFTDVKMGEWYSDAILWAAENGIVKGMSETTFAPDGKITREQIATILYRYAKAEAVEEDKLGAFPDADKISDYAKDAMNWAVAEGIINGSDGKLLPQDFATRAQISAILMRYLEK